MAHIIIFDEETGTAYYPGHEEEGGGDGEGRQAQPDSLPVSRWVELDINPKAFDKLVSQIIGKGDG